MGRSSDRNKKHFIGMALAFARGLNVRGLDAVSMSDFQAKLNAFLLLARSIKYLGATI